MIKITNNEKDRGGRGEDVGGRVDIGEQLIPLLLLCSSYDWAASPSSILNADSTLQILNFNSNSHLIILNIIFLNRMSSIPSITSHLSFISWVWTFSAFVAFIVLFLIYQILFIFHWQALLTYFSCCYLVNRFGALLSLSICQFPLGGFKVKVWLYFFTSRMNRLPLWMNIGAYCAH